MTKTIDIRFEVEDDTDVKVFIHAIGMNMEEIHKAVALKNDGFAHLVPDEETSEKFVDDDSNMQEWLKGLG